MTKGLPGSLVFQALLIERAGCGVVSEGERPTNQTEQERQSCGICVKIK